MNQSILAILLILLFAVFGGCSSSSSLPTQSDNPQLPSGDTQTDKLSLLYFGSFDIDLETQTITQIENRQSDYVYNITGFLPDKCPGGCFRFTIVGVVGTVLEIELTLENPLAIQVYDVRVMYLDLFGKTVLNPDSYTDFLGTPITEIYPFTAFTKEDPDRTFPVGPCGIDTEMMFLDFPPGAPSAVNYAITAHLPGMTPEPYEISEMAQTGELSTTGGNATISCKVDDHQDNISGVYMDATPFTGGPVQLTFNDPNYEVEISNTSGAPEGIYNQLIMAHSPNGQNISTYNYVEVAVIQEDPVAHLVSSVPPACINQDVTFDASGSTDVEDDLAGIPLNFEFDLDYDGIIFDADIPMSTDPILVTQFDQRAWYEVAVRVTDSDLSTDIASVAFAVSGLLPGDPEIDITDGSSITDIQFMHGLYSLNVGPLDIGQRPRATRGLAGGDGFVYTTFYGEESGSGQIYFARSDDDGASWSAPISLHTYDIFGEYGGCSIAADDTGLVCVVWADYFHRDLVLENSTDNGDTFSTNVIRDLEDPDMTGEWDHMYHQPDIAIDPNSTDNVLVSVQPRIMADSTSWMPPQCMAAYLSTSGASGAFVETFFGDPRPYDNDNIYNMQAYFLSDGDAYIIVGSNGRIIVMRSSDGGATWPYDDEHIDWSWEAGTYPQTGWHRETFSAFDPNDPETFYVVQLRRSHYYNHPIHIAKATDGLHLEELQWEINDNTSSSVYRFNPNVTVDDAGVVFVMWQSEKNGTFDIMADYSCDGGITFGTDIQFNTVDNNAEIDPFVIKNEAGLGIICVWEQNGFNSDGKLVARQG